MAILWQRRIGGVNYEVRSAGETRRLYTNGVLHTQYNPRELATGSVWDLLSLGALLLPAESVRRILVLGVGGGTVIRQLLTFFPHAQVTGVELSPVHLRLGKNFFALNDPRIELICADAIAWLAMDDGEPFDLIIDDLFGERDGVPCRAVRADSDWLDLLVSRLAPQGMLTMNFACRQESSRVPWVDAFAGARRRKHVPTALSLATPTCENRILSFVPYSVTVADLRNAVNDRRFSARFTARILKPGTDAF